MSSTADHRQRRPARWFAIALLGVLAVGLGVLLGVEVLDLLDDPGRTVMILVVAVLDVGGIAAIITGLVAGCVSVIRS